MKLKGSCHCGAVKFAVNSHTPYPFMRCYCSICRKTAGGGGYAINIMGDANTFKVIGKRHIKVYRAKLKNSGKKKAQLSSTHRHFCNKCASALWISDPSWSELVHPFASAIDTKLSKPPERIHMMLKYAANWVDVSKGKHEVHFPRYPEESIEAWHKRHGLFLP